MLNANISIMASIKLFHNIISYLFFSPAMIKNSGSKDEIEKRERKRQKALQERICIEIL
jgi:hypothetical protein